MMTSLTTSKFRTLFGLFALISGVLSGTAIAAEQAGGNLHISGGIAMPSNSTSVFTNPAGMVAAPTALVLQAGAPEVWQNGTYRAGLQTGSSSYGVAAGIEHRDRASNDPKLVYYGLAVGVPAFSLGLAGKTGISHADGTTLNAGALFTAGSTAKIGLTARGIDDGVNEFGAGVAFEVSSGVNLVFDAAADDDFDNLEMKPGLKVGNEVAALTVSYGTGPREQFADDFTAGGSYRFASSSLLEVQYNAGGDLSKYFASLTWAF